MLVSFYEYKTSRFWNTLATQVVMATVLMRGSRMQPQTVVNKSYTIFLFGITKLDNETIGRDMLFS